MNNKLDLEVAAELSMLTQYMDTLLDLHPDDDGFDISNAANFSEHSDLINSYRYEILNLPYTFRSYLHMALDAFNALEETYQGYPEAYKNLISATGLSYIYYISFYIVTAEKKTREEHSNKIKNREITHNSIIYNHYLSQLDDFLEETRANTSLEMKQEIFCDIIEYKLSPVYPYEYYKNYGEFRMNILRYKLERAKLRFRASQEPFKTIFSDILITLRGINDRLEPLITNRIVHFFKNHGLSYQEIETLSLQSLLAKVREKQNLLPEKTVSADISENSSNTTTEPRGVGLLEAAMIFHDHDIEVAKAAKNKYQKANDLPEPIGLDPNHSQRKLYEPAALLKYFKEKECYIPYEEKLFLTRLNDIARLPK